jgi:hypothetical protein
MKYMKYVLALAIMLCAIASVSHAQQIGTIQYIGSGSSALFIELGQAAATLSDTQDLSFPAPPPPRPHCYWSSSDATGAVAARDDRPGIPAGTPHTDEIGKIWIAWGSGASGTCAAPIAPYNVYSNMSLDSVIGQRCFFMVSAGGAGCIQILTVPALTAGAGLLGTGYTAETPIPTDLIATLNNQRMQEAATDIRPEDGKYASARMFAACGSPFLRNPYIQTSYQTYGLGYQTGTTGVGTDIKSFTAPLKPPFHVYDFNIAGTDPLSLLPLGGRATWAVTVVGAQPQVIVVSPNDGVAGRLASVNDIMFSTASEYFIGNYGRTSDLTGDTTAGHEHTTVALIREPLSGTYNVFEYSVPNSNEFKTSQDVSNCMGNFVNSNPMHIFSANGFVNSFRNRALGTSQVTAALQAAGVSGQDTIGYFFWSAGNANGFTATNGKYLTVNGIDPILDSYGDSCVTAAGLAPGQLPNAAVGGLGCVTFKNLNLGDYAIWSALRIVSVSPVPAGVSNLVNGAQAVSATAPDFIPLSALKVWKSHYNMLGIGINNNNNGNTVNPATPGDLCPGSAGEGGGDAGAITISIHGNSDFCTDFAPGAVIGINDKNQ